LTNHRSVLLEFARFLSCLVWTAIAADAPVPPADEGVRRCLRHWAWTPPPECDPFYLSETNGTTTTWWSNPQDKPGRAGLGFAETLDCQHPQPLSPTESGKPTFLPTSHPTANVDCRRALELTLAPWRLRAEHRPAAL